MKELDNIVEDSMTVDPKHHKHFVARRGEVLRRIGDEFGGVVVSFPRNGVAGDRVNLKGAKDCIDAAIARINEIVKDLEDMVTIDCEIQQTYHRFEVHIISFLSFNLSFSGRLWVPRVLKFRRLPQISMFKLSSQTKLLRMAKFQLLPVMGIGWWIIRLTANI